MGSRTSIRNPQEKKICTVTGHVDKKILTYWLNDRKNSVNEFRDGTKKLCFSKDTNAELGNASFQIYANIEIVTVVSQPLLLCVTPIWKVISYKQN